MPYDDVLRECQRYYQRITSPFATLLSFGMSYATTNFVTSFPLFSKMRATPTALDYLGVNVSNGNATFTVSNIALWSSNEYVVGLNVTTSGLTQYGAYYLEFSGSGYVGVSAEL